VEVVFPTPLGCFLAHALADDLSDGVYPDGVGIEAGHEFECLTPEREPLLAGLHADLFEGLQAIGREGRAQDGKTPDSGRMKLG
jgi:hypothetical protein